MWLHGKKSVVVQELNCKTARFKCPKEYNDMGTGGVCCRVCSLLSTSGLFY